jgi:hypothetical protein
MPWSHAASRLALTLRRWRGRFGIFAHKVAVRPQRPWYVHAGIIVAAGLVGAALVWALDPAGRLVGMVRADEFKALQGAHAALEEEVARLRGLLAARENDLQIEQAAQRSLSEKHKAVLEENARLKEELSVLKQLAAKTTKKK